MNKAFLIGNLTKDPESSQTQNGLTFCKFTIAVDRSYASQDGNRQTDFLPIVTWRNQAENCAKYLRKGSKVGICGSVQTRSYDDSTGNKRYITEIVADEVQFLSTKGYEDTGIPTPPPEYDEIPEVANKNQMNGFTQVSGNSSPFDGNVPF